MYYSETQVIPSVLNFPNFLARTNYQDPVDPLHSNYMDLTPERLNFFQRMSTDAQMNKSFSGFMSGYAEARLDWTQLYDFNELLHGFGFEDASHKLLVDVGGSREWSLESTRFSHATYQASCLPADVHVY